MTKELLQLEHLALISSAQQILDFYFISNLPGVHIPPSHVFECVLTVTHKLNKLTDIRVDKLLIFLLHHVDINRRKRGSVPVSTRLCSVGLMKMR